MSAKKIKASRCSDVVSIMTEGMLLGDGKNGHGHGKVTKDI